MNDFEVLLAEFENELTFKFRKDMPNGLPAIIMHKTVYINSTIPYNEAITYLVEEIGHYKTLADGMDIIDQSTSYNRRLELKGREWGYRKLVPKEKLMEYIAKRDSIMEYEIAEEFDLPDKYIHEVVKMYKVKGVM